MMCKCGIWENGVSIWKERKWCVSEEYQGGVLVLNIRKFVLCVCVEHK